MSGVESSRKRAKFAKKQQIIAAAAAIQDENQTKVISNADSNSPTADIPEVQSPNNPKATNSKPRGKAKVLYFTKGKGKGTRLEVEFNEMGQPIRQNAAKLSSFLGLTARELIPVTLDKWSDLTDEFMKQIWEHIMQKFSFAECYKKYTFGKLRRHWKDYRNLMVKKVMDQAKLVGLKRAATLLKPDSVESMEVWQAFIKKRTNPQQLAINEKYKEMRAKQTLPHRTSRKGFARLEDEMRQESETPDSISRSDVWIRGYEARKRKNNEDEEVEDPEIVQQVKKYRAQENGSSFRDDAVTKVLGPDPRGRIRGLGYGAAPSKLEGQTQMRDKVNKLENELLALKNQMNNFIAMVGKGGNTSQKDNASVQHSANNMTQSKRNETSPIQNSVHETTQSKKKGHVVPRNSNQESSRCKLLSWIDKSTVVATGEILSKDPKSLVHHVPLGDECWKVSVQHVVEGNESVTLYRPTREAFLLNEAMGSIIAWPNIYIMTC